MLEIVVSCSEMLLLERSKLFKKEDILGFCIMSSYGDIRNIENVNKIKIANQIFDIKGDFDNLNKKISNYDSVRIWYCSCDSEYLCNMIFLVNYLSKFNVNLFLIDTYDENHMHLSSYLENDVKKLLDLTYKLTNDEINIIKNKWNQLYNENNDLRIVENGRIKSNSFDYLDKQILNLLAEHNSISYYKFIGLCMMNEICGFLNDFIFEERINKLIKQNKIKIDKIVKEENIIGEYNYRKYISINKEV